MIRSNWTQNEILKILNLPLLELIFRAQKILKKYFPKKDVQLASLLSIKQVLVQKIASIALNQHIIKLG